MYEFIGGYFLMENLRLYQNIAQRTDGDIYIGVVGPVRTGKSTFIKKFMELLVLPNIDNEYKKERAIDELPQSASGRTIMTTEPKFIPNEAIEINLNGNVKLKTRLVDCVGYLVNNALGYLEDDMPRMVKTPWSENEMPFFLVRIQVNGAHLLLLFRRSRALFLFFLPGSRLFDLSGSTLGTKELVHPLIVFLSPLLLPVVPLFLALLLRPELVVQFLDDTFPDLPAELLIVFLKRLPDKLLQQPL